VRGVSHLLGWRGFEEKRGNLLGNSKKIAEGLNIFPRDITPVLTPA
jgi:hypothetical protein